MHPLAWLGWIGAGAVATLSTRNPLYLILLFGLFNLIIDVERSVQTEGLQRDARGQPSNESTVSLSPLRFALFAVPASAFFNLLTSHVGETVFARLPAGFPLIGGAFTVEALVYGAVNGLVLVTLFAAFMVLNISLPVRDLIAYIPRAFYPVAVVTAIAVTFLPNTVRQYQQVRDAQSIRGYKMRGVRDWLPLFLPVLIGGLERALQLAEAMTARGFGGQGGEGSGTVGERSAGIGPTLVLGLGSILVAGVIQLIPTWMAFSPFFLVLGIGLIGWTIWRAGRGVLYTRYRRPLWGWGDTWVVISCILAVLPLLILNGDRAYSPYPSLTWPQFDVRVGVALLALMSPAFVRRFHWDRAGELAKAYDQL